jgi:hypothetical protein
MMFVLLRPEIGSPMFRLRPAGQVNIDVRGARYTPEPRLHEARRAGYQPPTAVTRAAADRMKTKNAPELPEIFGFRNGDRGVHSSRSMMFDDLSLVMESTESGRSYRGYRQELDGENLLGKRTGVNKEHTARKLKALYGLDPSITIFRLLRHFWERDTGEGRPLMALLCVTGRDPLLRMLTPVLLSTPHGASLEYEPLEAVLQERTGSRFSEKTLTSIARRAASSWTQSGHLVGRGRTRRRATATPAAAAYGLALGYLEGRRGATLFTTLWARLLDRSEDELRDLAAAASASGLLIYRGIADVVEVRFPELWTDEERVLLNE